jgi:hypothetical protein
MRWLAIGVALLLAAVPADARPTHVRGYIRHGHYVAPHFRTSPDHSRLNNYSTKGNTNPFTGKSGHKSPVGR